MPKRLDSASSDLARSPRSRRKNAVVGADALGDPVV